MQTLVAQPLEILKAEFLTYYLFHRIKLGTEGYRDYESVASPDFSPTRRRCGRKA